MNALERWVHWVVFVCLLAGCAAPGRLPETGATAPTVPTAGWNPDRLDDAFRLAERYGSCSLIVMTHGKIIRSRGDLTTPHRVHSVRKALLGALVGQHAGSGPGQVDLGATLEELGIDDRPGPLTPLQKQATVLHLVKSTSGINHDAAGEIPSMTRQKARRLGTAPNEPGTIWAYNNWDYNALTTIFEQTTGLRVGHAFLKGIAQPLGMQDFDESSVFYLKKEALSMHAKAGFRMSARDLARFGQVYLDKGMWQGRQIIPAAWVERITADYTPTHNSGLGSGHGYLWWVPCDRKARSMGLPAGSFIASGWAGQHIVVIPAWDTVIVHTVSTDDYFGFCVRWARKKGFDLDQAVRYSRTTCRQPGHMSDPFCQRCRYYTGRDFETLLAKIIAARSF
ncbi:serine hydrolase [Desulfosarcina alkanivorans]|uniref:Serine hydrolase n=1 Tax=Desulfosarcina alkanivorans TaxID=571177 RepID=A0A5K7YK76_9BACT|nr:serine hydrolase [Desulfosarcina alkanivorans]BBO70092.1 serine hydrolase [Desulfosarcina alkanivorans]